MLEVSLQTTITAPWITLPPVRVGQVPTDLGTPDVYVLVQAEGEPWMRIDLYTSSPECFAFAQAIAWGGFIVIGYGSHAYLIAHANRHIRTYPLDGYFGHLYPTAQFLLVASAGYLLCLNAEGLLLWTTERLGIDGVIVDDIEGDFLCGQGEWDPPGGWKPFQVNVHTGMVRI